MIWEWKEMKGKKMNLAKWQKEWLKLEDEVDWNLCLRGQSQLRSRCYGKRKNSQFLLTMNKNI